jgi:flagellar biosynthesis/type III secretory pathway protein FliH
MLLVRRLNETILQAMGDGYVEGFNTGYVQSLNEIIAELTELRDHWEKKLEPIKGNENGTA